jgi:YjbE family integral membrane protein
VSWLLQEVDVAGLGAFFTQLQAAIHTTAFWLAVGQILWINVLLSGDNALVIAMACRGLHGRHRLWGMVFGSAVAVLLRIIFTAVVATLLELPYLRLAGGLALLLIAAKLLVPEDENEEVAAGTTLWHAVRIVIIADIVMSLDNVIAIAAVANGQLSLLILGLALSIPMIVAGAALIMLMLDRFPVLVWLGALLLGWIAGGVISSDRALEPLLLRCLDGQMVLNIDLVSRAADRATHVTLDVSVMETLASIIGAAIVLVAGSIWRRSAVHPKPSAVAVETRGIDLP